VTTSSAEMTKGYTEKLLSFQIFLISRVRFSYFVIFSASVFGKTKGQGNCYIYYMCCFILSISTTSVLLKSTVFSVTIDLL